MAIGTGRTIIPDPNEFNADRPFMYFIRDKKTDSVLFIGKYAG